MEPSLVECLKCALAIGAGARSRRLGTNLNSFVFSIRQRHLEEEAALTRNALREALKESARAAGLLTRQLKTAAMVNAIAAASGEAMYYPHGIIPELAAIARWADKAASSVIGGRAGSKRASVAPDELPALTYCSLIVLEAWCVIHERPAGANNAEAHTAASHLWAAATGRPGLLDWRNRFAAAKSLQRRDVEGDPAALFLARLRADLRHRMRASQSLK